MGRKKKTLSDPRQKTLDFELQQKPKLISVRCCPESDKHVVYGQPVQMGGRVFYCPECGIEWRLSLRTKKVKYFRIDEEGNTTSIKEMSFFDFNESSFLEKKKQFQIEVHAPSTNIIVEDLSKNKRSDIGSDQMQLEFTTIQ
ncbi:hypothetical protein M2444_004646 [Paenibacillus sp. PastF-3]|uniref:hypothetical protein n=1 Tax=Paenibacillus sp. PastF-3 TaxID=2940626 RepID=UPI00247395A1|nr:hypothetical protein [Paenibacillus sp. PastF-3]MDH6372817.1 hypothetical protein [Paenibacillus sp. PastF-3]